MASDPVHSVETGYIEDPNRRALELDIEAGRGPRLFRWITVALEHLIAALLVVLLISVAANVIGRSVFNRSIPWADELARMLFIWMIFMGAAAAFARYEHVSVDYLVRKMSPRGAYAMYLIQHLIITGVMGVILYGGYFVLTRSTTRTAILGVPWNLINVSVLICAAFIAVVAIWRAWQSARLLRAPRAEGS